MFWRQMEDWTWAKPAYRFVVDVPIEKIQSIIIDPTFFMADIDRENNLYVAEEIKEPLNQ